MRSSVFCVSVVYSGTALVSPPEWCPEEGGYTSQTVTQMLLITVILVLTYHQENRINHPDIVDSFGC